MIWSFFRHLTFHRQRDKTPPARHLRSFEIMNTVLSEEMDLAALLASRAKGVKASCSVTAVKRLQRLSILGPAALGGYSKWAVMESMRKQCAEQGVEFTLQGKSVWHTMIRYLSGIGNDTVLLGAFDDSPHL